MRLTIGAGLLLLVIGAGCFDNTRKCSKDSDCLGTDVCDLAINTCVTQPGADAGAGWTIALTAPTNGARVNGLAAASATLTFGGSSTPTLPATLTLSASPGTATSSLAKNGANTYSGTVPAGLTSGTSYTLQASYPNGQTDGGTVLSNTVSVTFDNVAPVFTVTVPPPPSRMGHPNVVVYDPDTTFDGGQAYRRDESVTVTVSSTATDVDAGSVQLSVLGIGAGVTPTPVTLSPCAGAGYCGQATVDLSKPTMQAFHGDFTFSATGADTAGNAATPATAVAGVTRWKWSYATLAGANVKASPAIGHLGTIYVGTSTGTTLDRFYALNPEGTVKWQDAVGSITASPAVGAWSGTDETVYVGAKNGGANLLALNGSTGADAGMYSVPSSTDVVTSPAVGPVLITSRSSAPVETAAFAVNVSANSGGWLGMFRPTEIGAPISYPIGIAATRAPMGVVTDETNFYFADIVNAAQGFGIQSLGPSPLPGWPAPLPEQVNVAALDGNSLLWATGSGGAGSVYEINKTTTTPDAGMSYAPGSTAWNLSIGELQNIFYVDQSKELGELPEANFSGGHTAKVTTSDVNTAAPLIGADKRVYAAGGGAGTLEVWAPALTGAPEWSYSPLGSVASSPNIDCTRDGAGAKVTGKPGVMYIGSDTGFLYSFIVDSRGIDTSAAWPKYQHDPRNTGNSNTGWAEFQCQ